jgi:hypothetical protein
MHPSLPHLHIVKRVENALAAGEAVVSEAVQRQQPTAVVCLDFRDSPGMAADANG